MRVTADLQQQLLPQEPLQQGDWRVCGRMNTSTEVGGDAFDYFMLDKRYLVVAIGDASGHGVPAGMLVAAAKATLHSLPYEVLLQPNLVLKQLNQAIIATASTVRLMTFFYMVIDTEQHIARYANAAQNFPCITAQPMGLLKKLMMPQVCPWVWMMRANTTVAKSTLLVEIEFCFIPTA